MAPAYLESGVDVARESERLGLSISPPGEGKELLRPFLVGSRSVENRLCALPMMGADADPDGSPSAFTIRRYQRYAQIGFGIIWFEATVVDVQRAASGQLCLRDHTVDAFARCVRAVRDLRPDALLILQLWPAAQGAHTDYIEGACRAVRAGFDGVDIACCGENVLSTMLADPVAHSLEDRARRLRKIVQGVRAACPELLIAVRLNGYQARRNGFGTDAVDYRQMNPAEPMALARDLQRDGVALLSLTVNHPNLFGDPSRRAREPRPETLLPHDHPLTGLARHQELGRHIRRAAPGLAVVGGGYSWLEHLALDVAAGAVKAGAADSIGLGRLSVLDPGSPGPCRLLPFLQADLWEEGGVFGCRPTHNPAYRDDRLKVLDQIRELPPDDELTAAFFQGRLTDAFRMLRRNDPLPEMSSHILPGARLPATQAVRQLRYMIAWIARDSGLAGAQFPAHGTGRRIAIIGGGPAGLAATVRLLEAGHEVTLFERTDRLGGAPALVYPEERLPDPSAEIDALLHPAIQAGRLVIRLGEWVTPDPLAAQHDAVLVATGCWREPSLGTAIGVWPALRFLRAVRRGDAILVPRQVVVLCGGDAAMDAAVTAQRMGAERIELVFASTRDAAYWHLPKSWFDSHGVHAQFETCPIRYRVDAGGAVCGVVTKEAGFIVAEMVIEALGLYPESVDCTSRRIFHAGATVNGGASVFQCMEEGFQTAEQIDRSLRDGIS